MSVTDLASRGRLTIPDTKSKDSSKFTPAFKWNRYSNFNMVHVGEKMSSIWRQNLFCDVILVGYDYEETQLTFNAHAVVLAASSEVLYQMFSMDDFRAGSYIYRIDSIDSKTLKIVIDYIYGLIPTNVGDRKILKKGAELLKVLTVSSYFASLYDERQERLKLQQEKEIQLKKEKEMNKAMTTTKAKMKRNRASCKKNLVLFHL